MVYIFILQKIVTQRGRLHLFFTFVVILVKFSAPKSSNFFLWKIWDIRNSKRAANINWWIFWMRNGGLILPFFLLLFIQGPPLTHSALGSTCCGTVLKVFRKCDRPNIYGKDMVNIRQRYPKYRSKISVRYEGSGGLIGTEGAKGI